MSCCTDVNPRSMYIIGDIYHAIETQERGESKKDWVLLYQGVKSAPLQPLRASELYEGNQEVATNTSSWLIRNESTRSIVAKDMAYLVDGQYHRISGVRRYKQSRKYLVLDTIYRDSDVLN